MHARNPVNWYPRGEEALARARRENKLIIISIAYAACHWCHVMEHESFEDSAVARIMNDNFVSIKVDREERPDVDRVYMNAAQLISGRGGWPLNAIALPDGRPIYAGTYYPKDQWQEVLLNILSYYRESPQRAEQAAQQLTLGIRNSELVTLNRNPPNFKRSDLDAVFTTWRNDIDFELGGQKGAPKFPLPVGYDFLLRYHHLSQEPDALRAVNRTLEQMAFGGIYDQVGGGFARYSVDQFWRVPHFEKMLYYNAQLVSLYALAFQVQRRPLYRSVVYETLEFIDRELTSPDGGFYSSLDADSEGEEGRFYVWTKSAIDTILAGDAALISDYYNVTDAGNWEHGRNTLYRSSSDSAFARKHKLPLDVLTGRLQKARQTLFKHRAKRVRPPLDDKILTAWNALMLRGFVDAYRVFGEEKFLHRAIRNAHFLRKNMLQDNGRLYRNYKEGKANINAFLDDYAFTIDAFIALYQATFEEEWLAQARTMTDYVIGHFSDTTSAMFWYTSDLDPVLIARKMEVTDNVIPASNSQMALNLFSLGEYFYEQKYLETARQMLNNVKGNLQRGTVYYANWCTLLMQFVRPPYEVAIVGDEFLQRRQEFDRHFLPQLMFMGGADEGGLPLLQNKLIKGRTTIYVCRNKACKMPVSTAAEALRLID